MKQSVSQHTIAITALLLLSASNQLASGKAVVAKQSKAVPQTSAPGAHVHEIPATTIKGKAAKFTDADSGLQFEYPQAATVLMHPDKDSLAKVEGQTPSGTTYSVTLQNLDSVGGTIPAEASHWVQKFVFEKLQNYRKLDSATVWIGKHSLVSGHSDLISFTHEGQAYRQRWVYFNDAGDGKKLKLLSVLAPEKDFPAAEQIFNAVLLSVENPKAPHAVASTKPVSRYGNQNRSNGEPPLETFSNQVLSMSYPSGWQQQDGDKDTVVKVKSPETSGSYELTISRQEMYAGLTVDTFAQSLEDNFFSQLSQYRKLKQSYSSAGVGGHLHGMKESASFEINKVPAFLQCYVFIQGNHVYTALLTSAGVSSPDASRRFDQILSTLSLK